MDPNILNSPSSDVVLSLGTMWGSLTPGVYDVPFGALQNFTFDVTHTLKELADPNFRTAGAVASVKSKVTIKAESAQIRGRALQAMLGGALTYNSGTGRSDLAVSALNIRPTAFAIQVHSRNDPSAEVIATINKCVSSQLSMPLKPEDFVLLSPSFDCYGDPANGNAIFDISVVGDQTTDGAASPAAPTGVTATAGAASSGLIDLAWTAVAGATRYSIFRSTTTGSGYVYVGSTVSLEFVDKGTSSTHYYYVLEAETGAGYSGYSAEVNAIAP